jgi:antitoxin ParD1/3/4
MKAETKDTLTEVNISLPLSMKTFIDEVVAEGGYGTASEYVRELIEDAKRRRSQEEIEQRLLEALESGPATPMTKEDWEGIKQRGAERIRQKKAGETRGWA